MTTRRTYSNYNQMSSNRKIPKDKPWEIFAKILSYADVRKNMPNCFIDAEELLQDKELGIKVGNKYEVTTRLEELEQLGYLVSEAESHDSGKIYQIDSKAFNLIGNVDLNIPKEYRKLVRKMRRIYKRALGKEERTERRENIKTLVIIIEAILLAIATYYAIWD